MRVESATKLGVSAGLVLIGSATLAGAQDKGDLEKCDRPIGTLAVVEPQQQYLSSLSHYGLGSPVGLIRMMVQNSNCFLVVERGAAMQNIQQERALARAGEMQQDANMGGGQMKAADFILTPAVVIAEPNAGGAGGALGGLLGNRGFGAIAGGLKFKEAQTSTLVADARTTIQVLAAEGKAKKTDFNLGALGVGGGAAGAFGGYTNTNEGKVIAASFLDNYNAIVRNAKSDQSLMARADKFKVSATAGAETKSGSGYSEGDVLVPKIDNVKLQAEANDAARTIASLKKSDEMVFLGAEDGGYLKVQASNGEGWVKKTLVQKK
jgi:hypothetical protein